MKKLIIVGLIAIVLLSGCVGKPKTQLDFAGQTLNFRADLDEARNIVVYPNETMLRDILLGPHTVATYIAYYPNDAENSYYLAAAYELAYKLTIINKYYWGSPIRIETLALNSSDELFATEEEPVILLLGPSKTNETSIKIDNYLITASGKDFSEVDRTYTDLDLAADKILLVLMEQNNL